MLIQCLYSLLYTIQYIHMYCPVYLYWWADSPSPIFYDWPCWGLMLLIASSKQYLYRNYSENMRQHPIKLNKTGILETTNKRRKSFKYVNQYVSKSSNSQSILHKVILGRNIAFCSASFQFYNKDDVFFRNAHIFTCVTTQYVKIQDLKGPRLFL